MDLKKTTGKYEPKFQRQREPRVGWGGGGAVGLKQKMQMQMLCEWSLDVFFWNHLYIRLLMLCIS